MERNTPTNNTYPHLFDLFPGKATPHGNSVIYVYKQLINLFLLPRAAAIYQTFSSSPSILPHTGLGDEVVAFFVIATHFFYISELGVSPHSLAKDKFAD